MTQRIMKTNFASKCLSLKKKIETIEEQLKESYIEPRKTKKTKQFLRPRRIQKLFTHMPRISLKLFGGLDQY